MYTLMFNAATAALDGFQKMNRGVAHDEDNA